MAIPSNVYRVVLSGDLPGGEIWSTGFWVQGVVPTSNAEANTAASLWHDECEVKNDAPPMRALLSGYCNSGTSWEKTSVYCYPDGGPHAAYVGEYLEHHAGSSSGTVLPNQCAWVATLRTDNSGRRARGRMYLPLTGASLAANGQLDLADCTALASNWAACFGDWNSSGDNGVVCVVSSAATHAQPVSSVSADSRVDIQRRRAKSQAVAYKDSETVPSS